MWMRGNSLRRLIGRVVDTNMGGAYTTTATDIMSKTSNGCTIFPTCFQLSHFGEYTKNSYCHMEDEVRKGRSSYASESKVGNQCIQKGDVINLNDLLFTKNRDYLVKNNNEQVKTEQLEGKVIGIYFMPLLIDYPQITKSGAKVVIDVYNELQSHNNFEVVLVAFSDVQESFKEQLSKHNYLESDCQKQFEDAFSYMPWTAIPFSDVTSRKYLSRIFGVCQELYRPRIFVVDPTGMVLECDAWDVIQIFGTLGYPFSDERIKLVIEEDVATAKQPSLKTLLGSPQRDYVISNKGHKVPIHTLEDKVVALLFATSACESWLFKELKLAYDELAKVGKNFEVVLVYLRESGHIVYWEREEEVFWETFKTMPWLALPFEDLTYKKLDRIFQISRNDVFAPGLVIFGPRAEFIEPFGADILLRYGILGYPFTRQKAAELETEKLKDLKLEMLWDPNYVFRTKDGSQVPFCQLTGKRIMVFLESTDTVNSVAENLNINFLMTLEKRYLQTKGTDDEFEVIRILLGNTESSTYKHYVGDMPYLVSLASELKHADLWSYFWHSTSIGDLADFFPVFAFNKDGKLVRKTMYPTFEGMKFPFSAGGLEEEALAQLNTHFQWNYWNYFFNRQGLIYSYSDKFAEVRLNNIPMLQHYHYQLTMECYTSGEETE